VKFYFLIIDLSELSIKFLQKTIFTYDLLYNVPEISDNEKTLIMIHNSTAYS